MNRRAFFGALVFGGAALPGSLKAVSVPMAPQILTFTQAVVRGLTIRGNVILTSSVRLIERCRITVPWNRSAPALDVMEHLGPLTISRNYFAKEQPPFWARVLRLNAPAGTGIRLRP